ncbi:MAG TPA: nicotinamide-nucleotide amidohydrolase family protein [Woeseiaceae bacterium]|nr:nicotinamide-nucleotide amidohydrolase family protein [Woeseiaceae bacterium]
MTEDDIEQLAIAFVSELTNTGKTVATAESCTGGWVAKTITDVPGSSAVFSYGVVAYSDAAKTSLLGVSEQTLAAHGAVSKAVASEMATGVLRLSGAHIAVAVSGIAGPDGGSEEKPVGTVWFAWALRHNGDVIVATDGQRFDGERDDVRRLSVVHALQGIRVRLQG